MKYVSMLAILLIATSASLISSQEDNNSCKLYSFRDLTSEQQGLINRKFNDSKNLKIRIHAVPSSELTVKMSASIGKDGVINLYRGFTENEKARAASWSGSKKKRNEIDNNQSATIKKLKTIK